MRSRTPVLCCLALLWMSAGCSPGKVDSSRSEQATVLREDALADAPPVLTVTPGTTVYVEGSPAVAIDPHLTVTAPDSGNITGAKVSISTGFVSGQDVLEVPAHKDVSSSFNAGTGVLSLTGTASAETYATILRSVTYKNTAAGTPATRERRVTYSIGSTSLYNPDTGHYYEFIKAETISWTAARDAAFARRYYGLTGYLVTVTSEAENTFVKSKLEGQGWMGASDAAEENTWRWVTGPEGLEDGGAGRHFFTQVGSHPDACSGGARGNPVSEQYNLWNGCEPNNHPNGDPAGEDYAHFLVGGAWNDYPNSFDTIPGYISGYIVEYGGMPGEPVLQTSGTRDLLISDVPVYSISVSSGPNGTVSPSGNQWVKQGQSLTFTLTPAPGYQVRDVLVDGVSAGQVTTYTFSDVRANHAFAVTFGKSVGSDCGAGSECLSGHCVDGVCCDVACTGQCEACDVAGQKGTCSPVTGDPHGVRTACASDGGLCGGRCDGTNRSACLYPDASTQCRAPSCGDSVATLAASCDGKGRCPLAQTVDCRPFVCGANACQGDCTADTDCTNGNWCAAGVCVAKQPAGVSCGGENQCDSGHCVDGVCCETACDGQCEACDVVGARGTCVPVTGAPHGARPACVGDGSVCSGTCDGQSRTSCAYPEATVQCVAAACAQGVETQAASCNGAGQCTVARTSSCGLYACGETSCKTTCTGDTDCGAEGACVDGACKPRSEVPNWVVQGGGGCSSSGSGLAAGLLLLTLPLFVRRRGRAAMPC